MSCSFEAGLDFVEVSRQNSSQLTHSYHHFPMRFIPQLASLLIERYSRIGETVADPFMGSGTVLVEARLLNRSSWGVDINPAAFLIAEAKSNPLEPEWLELQCSKVAEKLSCPDRWKPLVPKERLERLKWWFSEENILRLGVINRIISRLPEEAKPFFLCALSSILKKCSRWSPDSIKPIRSEKRHRILVEEPFAAYARQMVTMAAANREFWAKTYGFSVQADARLGDSRNLKAGDESVDLIVTSPPYVTAYDYTEVFELSLLWLGYDPRRLRKRVIGARTIGKDVSRQKIEGTPWGKYVSAVAEKSASAGIAVSRYYSDMHDSLREMVRVLRPSGHIALVCGDSNLRGVHLPNCELFGSILMKEGLRCVHRGERTISGRSLPPARDPMNGQFRKSENGATVAYRTEKVVVYQKPRRG